MQHIIGLFAQPPFQYEERRSRISQICREEEHARVASAVAAAASYIAIDDKDGVAYCSIAKVERRYCNLHKGSSKNFVKSYVIYLTAAGHFCSCHAAQLKRRT